MAHLLKTSFHQNPNVGLYAFANNNFCFLPRMATELQEKHVQDVLAVPVHKVSMCGTSLIGVFVVGNRNKILVPHIILDNEVKRLEHLKIAFHILPTDHTALGNNIATNDHACLINPELEPFKSEIKKQLGVSRIEVYSLGGTPTVGSMVVLNDKGCLLTALATEDDAAFVEKFFRVPVTRGTVNLGSPYVSSGVFTNAHGFVYGDRTGGPEAVNIDEALGFLR